MNRFFAFLPVAIFYLEGSPLIKGIESRLFFPPLTHNYCWVLHLQFADHQTIKLCYCDLVFLRYYKLQPGLQFLLWDHGITQALKFCNTCKILGRRQMWAQIVIKRIAASTGIWTRASTNLVGCATATPPRFLLRGLISKLTFTECNVTGAEELQVGPSQDSWQVDFEDICEGMVGLG